MNTITKSHNSLYYLNSLFDLSLGNYDTRNLTRSAAEMTTLFVPVASSKDKVLLDVKVKDEYWEYLNSYGLKCPTPLYFDEKVECSKGVVWGWNKQVIKRLNRLNVAVSCPDLSVVKSVNSRKFSFLLNKKNNSGIFDAKIVKSLEHLYQLLKHWNKYPLVIKPEFGNAGYGFIIKTEPNLNERELKQLEILFSFGNIVVVEPWFNRLYDISSKCTISSDGVIENIKHHKTLSNRRGTFFADWIDPNDKEIEKWRKELDDNVYNSAIQIFKKGYFGPVGFDSFVTSDKHGKQKLRAIIEINARHPMSCIAYALYDKLSPKRVSTLRFISKKRLKLPNSYQSLHSILGEDAFNLKTKEGIIIITPLSLNYKSQWIRPSRSAFFISAKTSKKLLNLDVKLRQVLSR